MWELCYPSRKLHACRHIGHSCRMFCWDSSHFIIHCLCSRSNYKKIRTKGVLGARKEQSLLHVHCMTTSSPYWGTIIARIFYPRAARFIRHSADTTNLEKYKSSDYSSLSWKQTKRTSSSAISHFQIATPCHLFTRTFILCVKIIKCGEKF